MFAYPKQAEFNRPVPKTRIYAHAKPSKRVKALFVAQVGEILWKYKLAPETLNLPARRGIAEIQVFDLQLRSPELDSAVLQAIDKAIPFPLLFKLLHEDKVCFAASWKRPSEADAAKWVIEATYRTPWQAAMAERPPLPVALDLAGLYEQLVRRHMPLPARAGETLAEHAARCKLLDTKQATLRQLESRLAREKQFNRKVELNAHLRELTGELASLQQP